MFLHLTADIRRAAVGQRIDCSDQLSTQKLIMLLLYASGKRSRSPGHTHMTHAVMQIIHGILMDLERGIHGCALTRHTNTDTHREQVTTPRKQLGAGSTQVKAGFLTPETDACIMRPIDVQRQSRAERTVHCS